MIYELDVSCSWKLTEEQRFELGFTKDEFGNFISTLELETPLTIEINTLEELNAFIHKWGRVVLTENTIEIYNGYRE